jgi:hypothetical protein
VSITRIVNEKESNCVFDFVLIDPSLIDKNNLSSLNLDYAKKVLVENIYRDALACISKMEDISHEYVRCVAATGT